MGVAVVVDSALRLKLGELIAPQLTVRLFRNDVAVTAASTLLEFEPCLFPGYADVDLVPLWPAPVTPAEGIAFSGEIPLLWTRGAGGVDETVFGWLVLQGAGPSAELVAGRRVDRPWPMNVAGQMVAFNLSAYLLRGF